MSVLQCPALRKERPGPGLSEQRMVVHFPMDNVELSFSEKTLNMIAAEAYRHGSGARGLRSVMEEKMKDIMFEIPEEIPKKSYKKQV